MSSIISGQVGDEGYHSNVNNLNCGSNELRSNIECALEVLCAKRSEFYDSSSEKGFEKDSGSVKSWDDVFEAVERFSHNTFTLLSWIEEFREVQDIKYDDSRNNRPSVSEWSESILKHVDRIYEEICEDGGRLLNDFAVEKATIRSVLKNVKLEYEIISPGWCEASREEQEEEGGELKCKGGGGGERTAAAENEKLDYENFDPPMSSTLVYDDDLLTLKDRSKYVSQDAHRVRLWWKLVCERENSLAWMQSIQRKIDIIASYYPTHTLRPLYQKYLTDVRARSDFRCALHSISDVITDLFPELRYKAKTLVYDAEEVYEVLERSIRKKLVDLEPEPSQTTLPHTRHVFRPYSPDYRLRPNSEYNLPPPLDDDSSSRLYKTPQRTADSKWSMSGIDELPVYQKPPPPVDSNSSDNQMSDFSFNQIRDRLHLEKDSALIKEPETLDEKMTGGQKDEDKDAVAGADAVENEKENSTTDEDAGEKLEMMTNPIEITEEALRLHSWMKLNENEAIESFNSKPIGWDPSVLGKFLSKNKVGAQAVFFSCELMGAVVYKFRFKSFSV